MEAQEVSEYRLCPVVLEWDRFCKLGSLKRLDLPHEPLALQLECFAGLALAFLGLKADWPKEYPRDLGAVVSIGSHGEATNQHVFSLANSTRRVYKDECCYNLMPNV